jgi:hypothetical protein
MEEPVTNSGSDILRAALQDEPAIYREIEVESRTTLSDLAEAIVHAFDFEFDHAFGFYSKLTGRDVMLSQPKLRVASAASLRAPPEDARPAELEMLPYGVRALRLAQVPWPAATENKGMLSLKPFRV